MTQRDLILEYSEKWKSLGIETFSIKIEAEHRSKKLFRKMIKITDETIKSHDSIPNDFNTLGIILGDSGIFCLDIENIDGSVDNFYSILKKRGIEKESLLIEKSMNSGLHIYFKCGELAIKNKHFKQLEGVHFDVLTKTRAFTAPSLFNSKRYEWLGDKFNNINTFNDIPSFPLLLSDFLDI